MAYFVLFTVFGFILVCENQTYGLGCSLRCGKCTNGETCNHVNGSCLHGCSEGVQGYKCQEGG